MVINFNSYTPDTTDIKWGIALINPLKNPIHLGFIFSGFLFELTNKGFIQRDLVTFFKWTKTRTSGACLIKLNTDAAYLELKIIEQIFLNFSLQQTNITCLDPIKEILKTVSGKSFSSATTIFDLIALLTKNSLINNYYWLGKEHRTQLTLKPYDRQFVLDYLSTLNYA